MSINIEYKIKPYFTKDTLMSFLCKDINYIDTDKAKNYVEGYLSKRMVMASMEVVKYYSSPESYNFFDKGEEMTEIVIPLKYKEKIEQLIKEWNEKDNANTAIKPLWKFS